MIVQFVIQCFRKHIRILTRKSNLKVYNYDLVDFFSDLHPHLTFPFTWFKFPLSSTFFHLPINESLMWFLFPDLCPTWNYSASFPFPQPVSLAHPEGPWHHTGPFLIAFDCLMDWCVCMRQCNCNLVPHICQPSGVCQLTIMQQHQTTSSGIQQEILIMCRSNRTYELMFIQKSSRERKVIFVWPIKGLKYKYNVFCICRF